MHLGLVDLKVVI